MGVEKEPIGGRPRFELTCVPEGIVRVAKHCDRCQAESGTGRLFRISFLNF